MHPPRVDAAPSKLSPSWPLSSVTTSIRTPETGTATATGPSPASSSPSEPLPMTSSTTSSSIDAPNGSQNYVKPGNHDLQKRVTTYRQWLPEAASLLSSICCLIVIITVLDNFNGRELPSLPLNVTLNTFLNFFSYLAQLCYMYPVAHCISQTKWIWFQQSHVLEDFELFEESSQGPWGGLKLLWRVHVRTYATLGAVVTIANLVTGPLTQQMLVYPSHLAPSASGVATVGTVQVVTDHQGMNGNEFDSTLSLQMAITTGFGTDATVDPILPTCSSGNCTFPQFQSLGLCYEMANITSSIIVSSVPNPSNNSLSLGGLEYTIPGISAQNISLAEQLGSDCYMVTQGTKNMFTCAFYPDQSLGFKNNSDLMRKRLLSMAIIFSQPTSSDSAETLNNETWTNMDHYGMELIFYPCVNTFQVHVEHNVPTTTVMESASDLVAADFDGFNQTCSIGNTNVISCSIPSVNTTSPSEQIVYLESPKCADCSGSSEYYGINRTVAYEITGQLYGTMVTFMTRVPGEYEGSLLYFNTAGGAFRIWDAIFEIDGYPSLGQQFSSVDAIINNVATSVTNLMRTPEPNSGDLNAYWVNGTVSEYDTFVEVRWGWIVPLTLELALAILFVVITILHTARLSLEALKGSVLATLVVLDDRTRTAMGGIAKDAEGLQKKAAGISVRLEDGKLFKI